MVLCIIRWVGPSYSVNMVTGLALLLTREHRIEFTVESDNVYCIAFRGLFFVGCCDIR